MSCIRYNCIGYRTGKGCAILTPPHDGSGCKFFKDARCHEWRDGGWVRTSPDPMDKAEIAELIKSMRGAGYDKV